MRRHSQPFFAGSSRNHDRAVSSDRPRIARHLLAIALGALLLLTALPDSAAAAPGDAPTVTDPVVTDVTTRSASFAATVNPNGLFTTYAIQFKEASGSEWQEAESGFLEGLDPVEVSRQNHDWLNADTDYLVRVTATNETGTTTSAEVPFHTLPQLPPLPQPPVVSGVTNDAAVFSGDVDPRGSEGSYRFEYRRVGDPDWIPVPQDFQVLGDDSTLEDNDDVTPVKPRSVSGLVAETEYEVRLAASNEFGEEVSTSTPFTTEPAVAPSPHVTNIVDLESASAGLSGVVHFNGEPSADWHFEYREVGAETWIASPDPDETTSNPLGFDWVGTSLVGLQPNTTYEARLIASGPGGTDTSSVRTFATTSNDPLPQPPGRVYEQVSPVEKQGADLIPGYNGFTGNLAAAGNGNRFAFDSTSALMEEAQAADSVYLSERTRFGWTTKPLSPQQLNRFGAPFFQFNDDLSAALMLSLDPPILDPSQNVRVPDYFRRDNLTDTYELLTTAPAEGSVDFLPEFGGASPDLTHVVINTRGNHSYLPGAPEEASYLLSGGEVSVVSMMPGSEEPFSSAASGAGLDGISPWRAVSADGSRVIFSAPATGPAITPWFESQIYVRKDHGTPQAETIQVSAPEPGVDDPTGTWSAFYRGASVDGSKVFFTSCEKLTSDATADATNGDDGARPCQSGIDSEFRTKSDLYLYDLDANGGMGDLIDLTTQDPSGADVLEVVGISEDGSRVYFAARGALAPGAIAGEPNLYLWERGEGMTHIATVRRSDDLIWAPQDNAFKESRVTPSGSHLAFATAAPISPDGDEGQLQVYLFSADEPGQLACASCGGSEPLGSHDATLRNQVSDLPFKTMLYFSAESQKRNLSDDGRRLFFETAARLAPEDTNGQIDVYEYDALARVTRLLSSGDSGSRSTFASASRSGDDAFFWTRAGLSPVDVDPLYDIYDARVDGGFTPDPIVSGCEGDACLSPPRVPNDPTPGSSTFAGPGDPPPARRRTRGKRRCGAVKGKERRQRCARKRAPGRQGGRRGGRR